jgi:hypothetical protein
MNAVFKAVYGKANKVLRVGLMEKEWKQGFLIEEDDWTVPYFDPKDTSGRVSRRLYFGE